MGIHTRPRSFVPLGLYPSGDLGPWTIYTSHQRRVVSFLRAPPKVPPNYAQLRQRQLFGNAGRTWSALPEPTKAAWRQLAQRCHLKVTAYNAWITFTIKPDAAGLATLLRQARMTLAELF